MEQNENDTPPKVPPILKELNDLIGQVFLKEKKPIGDPHVDQKAAEEKLSDGRNPLTLKGDPKNN